MHVAAAEGTLVALKTLLALSADADAMLARKCYHMVAGCAIADTKGAMPRRCRRSPELTSRQATRRASWPKPCPRAQCSPTSPCASTRPLSLRQSARTSSPFTPW